MNSEPAPNDRAARLYGWILFSFPSGFRKVYGEQMALAFRDLSRRAAVDRRRFGRATLWSRMVVDTLHSALREHYEEWRNLMSKRALVAAAVLVFPFLFVVVNLLQYGAGLTLPWNPFDRLQGLLYPTPWRRVYDLGIILSPMLALALLVLPQLRITRGGEETELANIVIRKLSRPTLVLALLSLLVFAILGMYLISENLPCLLGQRISC